MKQLGTELDREVSTHIPQISSDHRYCQTLSRLMEMIHMMLYEEESKGSMTREDIYKMARALSRDTSPSSKRLPPTNRYCPLPFHKV